MRYLLLLSVFLFNPVFAEIYKDYEPQMKSLFSSPL
ncbi:MAG: hypothetical protein Ct9H300mP4_01150 [Gammaproteobacteria bacterium]|nr:MAG: hypothetical protein Ct9H300mP4_01150 [Gammaproteobacteria bacterium]